MSIRPDDAIRAGHCKVVLPTEQLSVEGTVESKERESGERHCPALWVRLEGHIFAPPSPPRVTTCVGFMEEEV